LPYVPHVIPEAGELPMNHDDMMEICRRWQEAFARRDLNALAGLYADAAIIESPLAGTITGREAVANAHTAIFGAFPEITHHFEPPLLSDRRAALVAQSTGTHTGTILGLPPTGRAFQFPVVVLLDVEDGLIVRDRRIYDFTGLLVQVGVLKAKPA
jgi:steroid delta-isomerase-like uncharacterized protein